MSPQNQKSAEYKKMEEKFSGDYRIMRVVMASNNPIDTLHKIQTNQYSISTFLDTLEMLDVKATVEDEQRKESEKEAKLQQQRDRRSR